MDNKLTAFPAWIPAFAGMTGWCMEFVVNRLRLSPFPGPATAQPPALPVVAD